MQEAALWQRRLVPRRDAGHRCCPTARPHAGGGGEGRRWRRWRVLSSQGRRSLLRWWWLRSAPPGGRHGMATPRGGYVPPEFSRPVRRSRLFFSLRMISTNDWRDAVRGGWGRRGCLHAPPTPRPRSIFCVLLASRGKRVAQAQCTHRRAARLAHGVPPLDGMAEVEATATPARMSWERHLRHTSPPCLALEREVKRSFLPRFRGAVRGQKLRSSRRAWRPPRGRRVRSPTPPHCAATTRPKRLTTARRGEAAPPPHQPRNVLSLVHLLCQSNAVCIAEVRTPFVPPPPSLLPPPPVSPRHRPPFTR